MTAAFVDTNILLYAVDARDERKHRRAIEVLTGPGAPQVVISVQVLSEFANAAGHPRKLGMPQRTIAGAVSDMEAAFEVLSVEPQTVLWALMAQERWRLSYYDAQIWATAALGGIETVLSEDFADGLQLGPVRFANPLSETFDPASL